jgi:hypothetical protein
MNNEYIRLEKFANGLTECYQSRMKDHIRKDNPIDKMLVSTLRYAIETIDIHLSLARLDYEAEANRMAADLGGR